MDFQLTILSKPDKKDGVRWGEIIFGVTTYHKLIDQLTCGQYANGKEPVTNEQN